MKKPYNGMRKGISLVEMTIAVILFGVLSTIAMMYYKSLFNTDLTSKKARVAALMDQGRQLSGAYDVYVAQMGVSPTDANLSDFNATNVMILKRLPRDIREMSTTGWELNSTGIVNGRPGFLFPIDLNGTGGWDTVSDDELYCAIFNHEINSSVEYNVTNNQNFGALADLAANYDEFCYSETVGADRKHWIVILK
jgi:prepilin-type N-terminal cleavage/methylation domain-containing protein